MNRTYVNVCVLAVGCAFSSVVHAAPAAFGDWPEGLDPKTIGRRVIDQFLTTDPEGYKGDEALKAWEKEKKGPKPRIAKGYTGYNYGGDRHICYSVASIFVNAFEYAELTEDASLAGKLDNLYRPFLPGGKKQDRVSVPRHVDFNIFGAVPLEHFIMTGNRQSLAQGLRYADDQWEGPRPTDRDIFKNGYAWLESHWNSDERQLELLKQGYTPQTRLWIDDMYMINVLQTQAYRAVHDRKYVERAAKEMVLYLDKLQLENGLFNHSADVPYRWSRGNGWMAAGMPMILQYLKPGDEHYDRILAGYRKMMATLLKYQHPSGLWGQLIDVEDARNWDETSGTLMFAYAFIQGCKFGWLDLATYAPAARKAYLAVAASLDKYANVPNVCIGTGAKNALEYYFKRDRVNGDPHGQAPMLWCVNALLDYDTVPSPWEFPAKGVKISDWQRSYPPIRIRERMRLVEGVKTGALRLVPTYVSCSVVWGSDELKDIALQYRAKGAGAWKTGEKPVWFGDVVNYRGSIFRLEENTEYEMRLVSGGKTVAGGAFRTWTSDVPIAKTVVVDPATAKYPIEVKDQGSPDGWILYTTKPGVVIGDKDLMKSIFRVDGAKYVILENMTLVGGGGCAANPIFIQKSTGVRVRNCEISGYGRVGAPDLVDGGGKFRTKAKSGECGDLTNWDAGVMIYPGSEEVTVERCYFHDARHRSNSWYYSHPSGTEGIFVFRAHHSVVLRWNDIVGSDLHRWNDAIEGCDNFGPAGGFNRDADIYGNFAIFANDDNIELDGGQQNVRCFDNRFEAAVTAVSIQGCCTSPSYVFDNLLGPCCDEKGKPNPAIKTSCFDPYWYAPYCLISGNYMAEKDFSPDKNGKTARYDIRENTFSTDPVPNAISAKYPIRDLPFILDRGMIAGVTISGSTVSPASVTFKAIATAPQAFRVRQNLDGDWYRVEPSEGTLKVGENVFTVTFVPEKMVDRRNYRAAFLIRTPEGLSRCMSVYAERPDFEPPLRPVPPSATTQYFDVPESQVAQTEFTLEKEGDYWVFFRAKATGPAQNVTPLSKNLTFADVTVSFDGEESQRSKIWVYNDHFAWILRRTKTGGSVFSGSTKPRHLEAGKHVLSVKPYNSCQKYVIKGLAITADDPVAFEPR